MLIDQELDNKASSHKLHNPKPVVGKGSFKSNRPTLQYWIEMGSNFTFSNLFTPKV